MSKYGNKKVVIDNIKFDSKMEADYYIYLKIKKSNKEIKDFEIHKKIVLQKSFKFKDKTIRAITYTPDFVVTNNDNTIDFIDVKGMKSNEFKIKEKLFKNLIRHDNKLNMFCVTLYKNVWVVI